MTTTDFNDKIIKDLAAENFKFAEIFESYGIDFCCKGNRPVGEACSEKGIDLDEMNDKLSSVSVSRETNRYNEWELDYLTDYILNNHHKYVLSAIPVIKTHVEKIHSVHGERHPELAEVKELFNALSFELLGHMQKEEVILFPAIKNLTEWKKSGTEPVKKIMNIAHPIAVMESEHSNAGSILEKLKELTNGYTIPADGCVTYGVTIKELEEFELDLHKHIFLENSILFPKAIELYNTLNG